MSYVTVRMKPTHSYIWEFKQPARDGDGNDNENAKKKSIGLTSKVQLCTCSTHFGRLLSRHCTTATWNYRLRKRTATIFSLFFGLKSSTQDIIRLHLANWASGNYYCFSKHRCSNQEELFFNIQLDHCKCVRRQFNL